LITGLAETPTGTGVTAAPAAVARPNTSAELIKIVRIIRVPLLLELSRNDLPIEPENHPRP
jgi:hypothetical protein